MRQVAARLRRWFLFRFVGLQSRLGSHPPSAPNAATAPSILPLPIETPGPVDSCRSRRRNPARDRLCRLWTAKPNPPTCNRYSEVQHRQKPLPHLAKADAAIPPRQTERRTCPASDSALPYSAGPCSSPPDTFERQIHIRFRCRVSSPARAASLH